MSEPDAKKSKRETDLKEFDSVFLQLLEDLTRPDLYDSEIVDVINRFREVLEYNVPFGKKNRGLAVVECYNQLVENSTDHDVFKARVLGWGVEFLQAFFLIADDIMDFSLTRRGKPCWYKVEDVRLSAINDSFFVETCIYHLLKHYFRDDACYVNLVELFHETTMQTVIGQAMDLKTAIPDGDVNFTNFTIERYSSIVKWKTAFYSFYLPVALAMHMAGISDLKSHQNAKVILLRMGHFFQVQDDYLDCYGSPEVIGKIGSDIEDNKCGWLVVQALERVNDQQRQILQNNYGQHDPDKVALVKQLYKDLDLERVYLEYEEESYKDLMDIINKCSDNLPKEMFFAFARKIYKRQK